MQNPIELVNAAKYHEDVPHKIQAWQWLQKQIHPEILAEFAKMYRSNPPAVNPTQISQNGLDLLIHFEGLRLEAYRCSAGVPTIGIGCTRYWESKDKFRPVRMGDRITREQAFQFKRWELERFQQDVRRAIVVPLTQGQFDALVSFAFNVGSGALENSTLRRLLNQGNYQGAANEFLKWNKANGRELLGLTRRRNAEKALFEGKDWRRFVS
jgi:lysozyme